ncbi:MAG: sulfatase [Blastopirellula sp.]|nr:MAG: sulfatase [Blastopirellula sp.]
MLNRRRFLSDVSTGLGSISLASLLATDGLLAAKPPEIDPSRPYAPRPTHFPAKAKSVLVIFCAGAVSQLETWDYKPELIKQDGKPLVGGPAVTFQGPAGELARPQYKFRPRGETGKMVSDLIPHLAELTDDFAFIHSLTSKSNTHGPAENFLSTGFVADGFPSSGAWISYALGSENQNLPAFVAIPDPRGVPQASVNNWGPGFLPAEFQGTPFSAKNPVRHLAPPVGISAEKDKAARALLERMNQRHLDQHPGDGKLAARIASYELAARMQLSVPEISDLSTESAHTLKSYGADDTQNPIKAAFARNCILARRLIESGVRFVQLFNGAYASGGELNWDGHSKLKEQYDKHAAILDQPTAAMIKDMKARGLLEDTLIVWCSEFGRMPFFQKGAKGRDHNPNGFTCWLTGAGIKPGVSHGQTDELGQKAVENIHPLYDLNATILHLLGLNHEQLTFEHNGVQRRLTNVEGDLIHEVLR